jgi:predicted dehydrogenase/RimJ/RimL family protein N-acetyltransferase
MRVAVLGQGSIGARHARLALELGHELAIYDPEPRIVPPPGAEVAESAEDCLRWADAVVVASPSSEHAHQARTAIEQGVPALVEKPIALDAARGAELDWLARERGVMLSVAMNLREHPGVRRLASLLCEGAAGEILLAQAWCGSWLPDWRAGDYRDSYSARRELGGGVLLDAAVHELDYLLLLAGPPRSVSALARHVSTLRADVEDVALLALELGRGGVAELSVDYFDRAYTRGCRIVGSRQTLHWSWEAQSLVCHDADGSLARERVASDVAPSYRCQLERFLEIVERGGPAPVPAASAVRVLTVLDAARRSAREGRRVALAPTPRLRAADAGDGARLLAWRNDPCTRRSSRDPREIGQEEHARWLSRTLADPLTSLWVAECDGRPVGFVRIGAREQGVAQVHVALAAEARGRGLASGLLVQAAARALAETATERLYAEVKPDNRASIRAFSNAGFCQCPAGSNGLIRFERSREHRRALAPAR